MPNSLHDGLLDLPSLQQLLDIGVRLGLAALLGGIIGYEREQEGKAAGLRTHMLVGLSSALFTVAPIDAGMSVADLSRVVQGIAAGIGFLGAAVWPRLAGRTGIQSGAHRSPDEIVETTLRASTDPDQQLFDAAEELSMLATLALDKFRKIRAAMTCFALAAPLVVMAALSVSV